MWKYYAVLSAVFAALTAILAKIGVRNVDSNLATAIRTVVILVITWGIVFLPSSVPDMGFIIAISFNFSAIVLSPLLCFCGVQSYKFLL